MAPQQFGRYEIIARLGEGGMATVYHAYDPRFKREVALKVLPPKVMHDPKFRKRFEREAQAVAALEHPALVPVYDFGEQNGQPYLVMRYMTGGSLMDRIKAQPRSPTEMAHIFAQLAPALDEAHRKGIIHRDIKPANILFDHLDNTYLTDFGVVKIVAATTALTTDSVLGTPHYMAPELTKEGAKVTPLVDVYALGITLYQALTGELPYKGGGGPLSVLMAHVNEPTPTIRKLRPDLSDDLADVVAKAMAKNPAERYQSAGDLAAALNTVVAGTNSYDIRAMDMSAEASAQAPNDPSKPVTLLSAPTQPAPSRHESRRPRQTRSALRIILLIALVALIVAAVILLTALRLLHVP